MDTPLRSWAGDRPVTSPFARPVGTRGRLAGRFMLWTNKQDDVLHILDVQPGDRVLEVGYGPGGLVRLLVARSEAAVIRGVDPSPEMRRAATKANRGAVRSGRVTLDLGTADHTGLADQSMDRVASVNNVGIWPDLEAGLRELHRVVRPGGAVVIAWHGGVSPGRITRRLRLPEAKLQRIESALQKLFADVSRKDMRSLVVFKAVR
ncbi:class I SAM-dependent methyltransferase [Streptomyces inhibens]|uniref:class I SAM-dependent methyltransferase n=1 Tax=Streptomyces inhibens TaxID=2293571 RepID=UPI001EE6B4FC|nr:methyltransferase domain-containing protein [Streptomyces inhibens]UKY54059.1 methyltransferase domain-containing protein [Streptomyces inhibens]